jgi:hypothetical protein
MRKENRWTLGTRHFVLPGLPDDLKGRHGCRLHKATFDPSVGEEVFALYLEEPDFAHQYSQVSPFNLIVHFGLVKTPYGEVAFIIWLIAAGSSQEITIEQYLNPQNIEALRLIASAANQTHFKFVIMNNQDGEVGAFIDFENVFDFDKLASAMINAIGHEPEGDFGAAMQHVMNTMTIPELLVLSALAHTAQT